ncbi:hypothetical protein GE21DRAFT_1071932 [Neurospora crassa]|nr:hypothetical protein GE21DRAFT_1071932 [Neurospora crassa]
MSTWSLSLSFLCHESMMSNAGYLRKSLLGWWHRGGKLVTEEFKYLEVMRDVEHIDLSLMRLLVLVGVGHHHRGRHHRH